jgi:protein-L-isoaspartate(D-aspartate) O-methyltransferase
MEQPSLDGFGRVIMADFAQQREWMVQRQIAARGLSDPALLAAFRAIPRELFVPQQQRHRAYDDSALPIEAGQTISQPFIVALMLQAASLSPGDHVLEVGAGSGYAAAVLSRLVRSVVAVERHAELARRAAERLAALGCGNVEIVHGDGMLGFPPRAPYDAILCAAANPDVPGTWVEQLAPGGRIVMPLGEHEGVQELVRLTLIADGRLRQERLDPVRFVPLLSGEA